jgi:archaemetzincin
VRSRVELVEVGDVPPGLAAALLAGLPPPLTAGGAARLALELEPCRDRTRAQTDGACLLRRLPSPSADGLLLALTGEDLFLPALTYVFGVSELGAGRGLLSWARLRPQGEEPADGAWRRLVRRVTTEAVHELGHALGLVHCPVAACAMHRTLWPEAIDLKEPAYCPTCRAAIDSPAGD